MVDHGGMDETCPACGHAREGLPAPLHTNKRLLRKGKPLKAPSCSSGHDMGWGDMDMCGCEHPAHSERLTTTTRQLS